MTAVEFRSETIVAMDAVVRAVDLACSTIGVADVRKKGDARDVVTSTDVAIEEAVRSILTEALGANVVGEEHGGSASGRTYWLVDPICGTRNFASGIPLYCVNVACVEDGAVTIAVVGDPSTGDLLVAERGRGAFVVKDRERRRTRCSVDSQTIVVEDSHAADGRREQAAVFLAQVVRSNRWDLRSLSTTLPLAYLAAGRVAAYALFWTSAVHAAAGALVAAEAGATVTDVGGEPWTIEADSLLAAADAQLHADLLGLIRQAKPA